MHNFFVSESQKQNNRYLITGNDYNHIINVLRMDIGDTFLVSSDKKSDLCEIENFDNETVTALIVEENYQNTELPLNIYLFQGLPKGDKMEFIIQKSVELGVFAVIPTEMNRCVVKLDDKKAKSKIQRWQQIAESAAKQSKRAVIPTITDVMSFKEALNFVKDFDIKVIPYEHAENMAKTKEILQKVKPGQKIAIFIGPEGGFEESEVESALAAGVEPITLGKRILRTETAGFTMMSWIMYQLEQ